ncbi:hypothetical protein GCM10029963_60740 [Micromonospora andamanensis]
MPTGFFGSARPGRALVVVRRPVSPVGGQVVVPANRMPSTPAYAVWLCSPRAVILAWERFHGNGSIFSKPYRDKCPIAIATRDASGRISHSRLPPRHADRSAPPGK